MGDVVRCKKLSAFSPPLFCHPLRGLEKFIVLRYLGLTPQALCLRLLRKRKPDFSCKARSIHPSATANGTDDLFKATFRTFELKVPGDTADFTVNKKGRE